MSCLVLQNLTVLLHRATNRRSSPLSDQNPSAGGECRTVRFHHRMRNLSIRSESAADTNNGMPKLSQYLSFPLLVNGCTGNMGKEVIKAATNVGLRVVPVSFSSREGSDRVVQVDGVDIKIHGPSERDGILASLVQQHQGLVVVDFTLPTAVNAK
ncbi:hypothetical protein QJS10_CPB21g00486 [Acorus calamus]|uniref:Dihydrodipicolinate reductase N-terminal domain-containing protein n=1 Tax=Acorus calamus TaxID=4465 RepID=A0AAV9C602_ACOCL|nr:hypothetical protein QJS10_CPB21g00486 [Acorus calamus]